MLLYRSFLRPLKALALSLPLFASTITAAAAALTLSTALPTPVDTCAPLPIVSPFASPSFARCASMMSSDSSTVAPGTSAASSSSSSSPSPSATTELPVLFLSHCAPILLMDSSPIFGAPNNCHRDSPVADWYRSLPAQLDLVRGTRRPKAIVMLSAHWESSDAVEIAAQDTYPGLYYDYYGFPKHTYEVTYPAPGSVALAKRIQTLFSANNIPSRLNTKRNIDHGGFIPLLHMYPEADIPVLQLSIYRSMDPAAHLRIGHALAPLRREGVLLVGSGQFTHGAFGNPQSARAPTQAFVEAMTRAIAPTEAEEEAFAKAKAEAEAKAGASVSAGDGGGGGAGRVDSEVLVARESVEDVLASRRGHAFINWASLPHARLAHPREDHFMPLGLVLGAAKTGEEAFVVGDHWITHMHSLRSVAFGDVPKGGVNKKIVAPAAV